MSRIFAILCASLLMPAAFFMTAAHGQSPALAEAPLPTSESKTDSGGERLIQFSFDKADWKDVIPWFAEQTGYSWQPISEWPEGTFTLSDNETYTPMEALDQINYALRLRTPPYTIIRNRNQLILADASSPLPEDLIETVTVEELDQRGDYEIVNCHFSLGEVNVADVEQDLRQSISPSYQQFARIFPTANEFRARDTGAHLRQVRDTINAMTRRRATDFSTYTLKYYDAEQFMMVSRRLLGIADEAYQRADGSLVVVVDPSSNRLILKGTPKAIEEFKSIAAVVDVEADLSEENTERPYLKSYSVFTDPEIARKVLETMLDGTDATVGQDEATGAIVLRGRKEHHKVAEDTIATLRGDAGTTKIVQLQNSSASTILSAVQSLMNLSTDPENAKGPKLLANTVQNYIVIRGTPSEIFETEQMIEQLDGAQQLDPDRVRTNARIIKMAPSKRDDLMESIQDYWPATGRKNSLRIIMPEDRKKPINGLKRFRSLEQQDADLLDALRRESDSSPQYRPSEDAGAATHAHQPSAFNFAKTWMPSALMTGVLVYQPQDDESIAGNETIADNNPVTNSSVSRDYAAPPSSTSVPGSAVTIKGTSFGILIESDDLDALDDLESMLMQEAGDEGVDQGMTIFYLKYKKAASIKSALDTMFGLSSGSSGGDGGGMLGGIMDNMAGGGTGDLLGGLLGGGGSSASGAVIALEGDVQVGVYVPLNLLYVSGATQSDLEVIQDAIDTFDQPSAPQDPELAGQFWAIEIEHRDPEDVLERVRNLMADYIQSDEKQSGDDGGGNAPEQMAKMVRKMAGGGGDDGGSETAQEIPKIRIDLDKETDQILITGPEFIYRQVLALVERIDTPAYRSPKTTKVLASGQVTPAALKIIQQTFGSKVVMVNESDESSSEDEASKTKNGTNASSTPNATDEALQKERAAQQQRAADFFRNLRNNGGRGQTGGRAQGGRGQTGGGRGQGGRGGRR